MGYSAGDATGGTTTSQADAAYSNVLHLAATASVLDAWGTLTLTFGANSSAAFSGTQTFTLLADTDLIGGFSLDVAAVPEPATFAMVGLALAALGAFRIRRRRRITN